MIDQLIEFRHELHKKPELSGREFVTASMVSDFLKSFNPHTMYNNQGGAGLAAVYKYEKPGPTIVIRCELDALPIIEKNDIDYRSTIQGVSHKCGHDGHMAMVAGMAPWLENNEKGKGNVLLLFQPSEENGRGAEAILESEIFKDWYPDYFIALHNLPGIPLHQVVCKKGVFSASVRSVIIKLTGLQSHASTPELGINPTSSVAGIISSIEALNQVDKSSSGFKIITPIYIHVGEKAYGISPAHAELHFTMRTWTEDEMRILCNEVVSIVENISSTNKLSHNIEWLEVFPSSVNSDYGYDLVERSAEKLNVEFREIDFPLIFGEDFGHYSQKYSCVLYGLGAGEKSFPLHHPDYDFPDEIIETGMNMYQNFLLELWNDCEDA